MRFFLIRFPVMVAALVNLRRGGIEKTPLGWSARSRMLSHGKKEIDADLLEELEYALITADVGVRTATESFVERSGSGWRRHLVSDASAVGD
jgi:fused signal recognition particle receptor